MKLNRKNVVQMTSELEMLGFLKSNGTACRFLGMTIKTPVVKIRAGNPWGAGKATESGLYKLSRKIGIINADYCAAVERRIAETLGVKPSEVEYKAGETWYVHLTDNDQHALPVCHHKDEAKRNGTYYLQYFPQTEKSVNAYVNEAGEPVSDELVKPWLYTESERPAYKPKTIVVKLANIKRLAASEVVLEMPELDEIEAVLAD